jgi:hypothetical protein
MNPLFHRHLVAAYAVTWIIQLTYLAYVAWKWITAPKVLESGGKNQGLQEPR